MRSMAQNALFSAGIGVALVFLMFVGRQEVWGWRLVLYGAACGAAISLSCRLLDRAIGEPILRRTGAPRRAVKAALYLVGGEIGFVIATLATRAFGVMPFHFGKGDWRFSLMINGGAAISIGLAFSSFAALQKRLRESIERIKEQEFAEKELALAREIQTRLLPPDELKGRGWIVGARNVPAGFVAGDFYDVFRLSDGDLGIAVADVSGKGIGASLIMASTKAALGLIAEGRRAHASLTELNARLFRELAAREFVALTYARFDPETGKIEIANAGLPDPYLIRRDGALEPLSAPEPRYPLGVRGDVVYRSFETTLRPGERVLFFTDGLPEAPTADAEPIGYAEVESLVPRHAESPRDLIDTLFASVRAKTRPVLEDDWTALVLEAQEAGASPISIASR
jgi:serine phosphatase RsbU (regulator of sigma subunit)